MLEGYIQVRAWTILRLMSSNKILPTHHISMALAIHRFTSLLFATHQSFPV
nr:MAG TPA: hypothetical protein [Caudoviricetes sp.]